jgi:hypothetical protein
MADDPGWYSKHITPNADLHTYMSFMVAMMLSFRTNSCFARYNEGVGVSGKMRTHARSLVSQAAAYVGGSTEDAIHHVDEIRRVRYCCPQCLLCLPCTQLRRAPSAPRPRASQLSVLAMRGDSSFFCTASSSSGTCTTRTTSRWTSSASLARSRRPSCVTCRAVRTGRSG